MYDMFLLKLGEIVLKGANKRSFEQRLVSNIKRRMQRCGDFSVYLMQSTIYVEPKNDSCDMDAAFDSLKKVFGVVALSRAAACEKSIAAITAKAKEYLGAEISAAESFKVESKRSDKRFPLTSIQISQQVGGELADAFPETPVDVHTPALTVHVEIRDTAAYVHANPAPGAGGMPVGSNGTAVTLLSGGIDSPVSTYMIAKRGVHMIPVHFFSFPYTSEQAKEKVIELAQLLTAWCGRMTLEVVPFTHIQEEIRKNCPEELFTLIMRRFMMRIAEKIALSNDAKALVTGENLGQVASQTMEAMAVTESCVSLPVLRPLVGFDKTDIVSLARKIGTFETSILPYEDCCTVFTPRHPRTQPKVSDFDDIETKYDFEGLCQQAFDNIERVQIPFRNN